MVHRFFVYTGFVLSFAISLASQGAEKDKGLTRRGFLVSSAVTAAAAAQPAPARRLVSAVTSSTAGVASAAAAPAADAWVTNRVTQFAAERLGEAFLPRPRHTYAYYGSDDFDTRSVLWVKGEESHDVRLRTVISTEHFSKTLATLERELAESFKVDPQQVKTRGEYLRGVEARHDINLAGHVRRYSAPLREPVLGDEFDDAYIEGLKRVDEDYAAQVEKYRNVLKTKSLKVLTDRRAWRRACWYNHFISISYSFVQSDFDDGPTNPLMRLQEAAENLAAVQARARATDTAIRENAARAEAMEEALALAHQMDIEAVYEATDFHLRGGNLPWREGYRVRDYPLPPKVLLDDFMTKLADIAPVYARQVQRAHDLLENDIRERYRMRLSITPEAVSAIEDELSARFPDAYANVVAGYESAKLRYSVRRDSGLTRDEQILSAIERVLWLKESSGVDVKRPMREQIHEARLKQDAEQAKLRALDQQHSRTSVEPMPAGEQSPTVAPSLKPLEQVARPVIESCVEAMVSTSGPSRSPVNTLIAEDSPTAGAKEPTPLASEPLALPAPIEDPVATDLERVKRLGEPATRTEGALSELKK